MLPSLLTRAIAVLLVASTQAFANPIPPPLKNAYIVPLVNSHAATRRSEDYNPLNAIERDISRLKRKYVGITNLNDAGIVTTKRKVTVTLEPYDVGPARRAKRERRQSSAAASLKNEGDISYRGDIWVGTPKQRISGVFFDTGSSDVTVPSEECTICPGPFYSPEQSITSKPLGTPFRNVYGSEVQEGVIVSDTVSLGDLSVLDQVFGVTTNASSNVNDKAGVPILGLGFPAGATTGGVPWFINLVNQGSLASNVFSFYLTQDNAEGSELCIGCIDSSKFIGQPEYFPVISRNGTMAFWMIRSAGIFQGNVAITGPLDAVIDSGNAGIVLSDSNTAAFYAQIPGAVPPSDPSKITWTFPCTSANSLPALGFKFTSDTAYNFDASRLNMGPVEEGSDMCNGAVYSLGLADDIVIIGAAFMNTWYSVFDYSNMRIGLALAAH